MQQRDIKFRGWSELDGQFYYFNLKEIPLGLYDGTFDQQFTGLQDKGGKDIYEGDIVKYKYYDSFSNSFYESSGEVIFKTGVDCYNNLSGGWEVTFGERTKYINKNCEVIGNIFETPELLDEKTLAQNQKPAIKRGRGRPKKEIF